MSHEYTLHCKLSQYAYLEPKKFLERCKKEFGFKRCFPVNSAPPSPHPTVGNYRISQSVSQASRPRRCITNLSLCPHESKGVRHPIDHFDTISVLAPLKPLRDNIPITFRQIDGCCRGFTKTKRYDFCHEFVHF